MGRIASGKERIDIIYRKQKNNTTYVYRRISIYDKEHGYYITKEQKLIGKKINGTDEIVSTRTKLMSNESKEDIKAQKIRIGASAIVEHIGKESGIDADIYESCDEAIAKKIITLARYYFQSDGEATSHIENWQLTHSLEPYGYPISEDTAHNLFKMIGSNEAITQTIFLKRAKKLGNNKVLAYDSTTVSTYGQNHTRARYGYNKEADGLETDKTFTFYSMDTREPICFNTVPGNVPDVLAIDNSTKQLEAYGLTGAEVVTDCGFYSEKNISLLFQSSFNFLTRVPIDIKWIRSEIDKVLIKLEDTGNMSQNEAGTYGVTTCLTHQFKKDRKYSSKNKGLKAGDTQTFSKRVYLHIFVNDINRIKKIRAFDDELNRIRNEYVSGERDFKTAAQKMIDKFMFIKQKRNGSVEITFNTKAIREEKKYYGVFVLIANKEKDTFKALDKFRKREWIEDFFEEYKQRVGNKKYRVWDDLTMDGKKLIQFVALCYYEYFSKKLNELKSILGVKNGDEKHDLKDNLTKEKALKNWLNNKSIQEIFEWFDAIEKTDVSTPFAKKTWTTETIDRDKLFFQKLGIKL